MIKFDLCEKLNGSISQFDYQIQARLGTSNNNVFRVYNTALARYQAMKVIFLKNLDTDLKAFQSQVESLQTIRGKNVSGVIEYYGYMVLLQRMNQFQKNIYACITMQLGKVSLEQYFKDLQKRDQDFQRKNIQIFFQQSLQSFGSLQEIGIAHCDIKPQNIIILDIKGFVFRIGDVGSSKRFALLVQEATGTHTISGTVPFQAPQITQKGLSQVRKHHNPFKSDLFSLGLCVIYLATGKKFRSSQRLKSSQQQYQQTLSQWISEFNQLFRDSHIIQPVVRILDMQPSRRGSFRQNWLNLLKSKEKRDQSIRKLKEEVASKLLQKQQFKRNQTVQSEFFKQTVKQQFRKKSQSRKIPVRDKSCNSKAIKTRYGTAKPKRKQPLKLFNLQKLNPLASTITQTSRFLNEESPKRKLVIGQELFVITNKAELDQIKKLMASQSASNANKIIRIIINSWINQNLFAQSSSNFLQDTPQASPTHKKFSLKLLNETKQMQPLCLNDLKYISLDIKKMETSEQSIDSVMAFIQQSNCKQLQRVSLSFKDLQISTPNRLPSAKFKTHQFYLSLQNSKIRKEGLKTIVNMFGNASHFRSVFMDLSSASFQEQQQFSRSVQVFESLDCSCLNLDLSHTEFQLKDLKKLLQVLKKHVHLKQLSINLKNANIKFHGIQDWTLPLALTSLRLNLQNCLIGNSLNSLSIKIANDLHQLDQLDLGLQGCNLSQDNINLLFAKLGAKKALSKLRIILTQNNFSDLRLLRELVMKLRLQSLELGLSKTEVCLQEIKAFLRVTKQTTINKLTLTVNREQLVSKTQRYLMEQFEHSKKSIIGLNSDSVLIVIRPKTQERQKWKQHFCLSLIARSIAKNYGLYMCLTCSQLNPVFKDIYFCKYCIENCHLGHISHQVANASECSCYFLGQCKSSHIYKAPCSRHILTKQRMKAHLCLSCDSAERCLSCVQRCCGHNEFKRGLGIRPLRCQTSKLS